jgi:hypothetical protein
MPELLAALERLTDELGRALEQLRPRGCRTIHRRVILTTRDNPIEIPVQDGYPVRSILVENPNSAAGQSIEVGFTPRNGRPGQSDRRVPRQTGTMIVTRADAVSIGMDPAVLPAAGAEVFVTLYDEPQAPHSYPFAP